jgi:hypothetical protein
MAATAASIGKTSGHISLKRQQVLVIIGTIITMLAGPATVTIDAVNK